VLAALQRQGQPPDSLLAVDDTGQTLTYGMLDDLRDEWARRVPGRRLVALLCANTVPLLAAYIGLHAAGHVVILLSEKIAAPALADIIARFGVEVVVRRSGTDIDITHTNAPADGMADDLRICLSTSGSTGSPKLVRFADRQLVANAQAIAQYLALESSARPLLHLPFEYSFGLSVLQSHMAVGACVLLTEQSVMQKPFWTRLAQATSFSGVPFHFEMLLRMRLERADLPQMQTLTQAGGRLAVAHAETLHRIANVRGWQFHIMYGQTEAGPRISWLPHAEQPGHFDCIGRAIPGVTLDLGADGDLIVTSPGVMLGYAQTRDDLGAGDDMGGVLHTGDLAERLPDGLYRITGRKSRFIKLQGNRVSLEDVEMRMRDAGHEVACVGRDDSLALYVEATDTESVRQAAVQLFSFPARSLTVRQVPHLPRTASEKIDYGALQTLFAQEVSP
jgi:acyl-coenzyme A synthetase/AMP-(fatty) acid ligase